MTWKRNVGQQMADRLLEDYHVIPKSIRVRQFVECIDCSGSGVFRYFDTIINKFVSRLCPTCRGSGEVEIQ